MRYHAFGWVGPMTLNELTQASRKSGNDVVVLAG